MNNNEQRLRILKALLLIRVTHIDEEKRYKSVYFKLRKWNPILIAIAIHSVIVHVFKEFLIAVRGVIDEINEENNIQINK